MVRPMSLLTLAVNKSPDPVHSPSHYKVGSIETADAIEASMSADAWEGYLKGNILKYLWRYPYKGKREEDLRKARWYLDRLIKVVASKAPIVTKLPDRDIYGGF